MNKLFQKTIIALLAIVWSATTIQAQNVNTDRYIKLTVEKGQKIKLSLWADAAGTPIKIVSGAQEQTITVGSTWSSTQDYTASDGTMTIYGNVQRLNCAKNDKNITDIDLSHNTQMTMLYCEENALSTLDISKNTKLTRLSCQKNALTALDISHNKQLEYLSCFSNKLKALDVSSNEQLVWLNCYDNDFTTASLDDLFCSLPDRENKSVGKIGLVFNAASPEKDKVLATNGNNATSKNWKLQYYDDDIDIKGFKGTYSCGSNVNMSRYITLTVKKGADIQLDLWADAAGTPVKIVSGDSEKVITIGADWMGPKSYEAEANTMTIYGNVQRFDCDDNSENITGIDISHNTELQRMLCNGNALTTLDISHNKQLSYLACYGNKFTAATLDDIYCSLPDRKGQTAGQILPLLGESSSDKGKVLTTNSSNATARNWKIQYYSDEADITGFTGTHSCTSGIDDIKNTNDISVYPNPVKDILNIASDKPVHSIRIYNVYGTEVAHAVDTNSVDVSHLPAGVYMVRADGKVVRIIKK